MGPAERATEPAAPHDDVIEWGVLARPFSAPDWRRSVWQLTSTTVLVIVAELFAWLALRQSIALTLLLDLVAAGLLVRLFIFQHDCGHGSFFASQRTADIVGCVLGFFTLTPYFAWRHAHAIHHATTGDLERRGVGDVNTLTLDEYLALPTLRRLTYRLYRNPLVMFGFGATWLFFVLQRFPGIFRHEGRRLGKREVLGVHLTTGGAAVIFGALALAGGWQAAVLVHGVALAVAATVGVFLFYIQHQHEDAYWRPHAEWEFSRAALQGASSLRLPTLLRFFTGNIGIHHVHHLAPRVANYNLARLQREHELLRDAPTLGMGAALRTVRLKLYDEAAGRMIGWREVRAARRAARHQHPGGDGSRGAGGALPA